jgi:hypothetical protein
MNWLTPTIKEYLTKLSKIQHFAEDSIPEVTQALKILNDAEVDYVVVGGMAAALYSPARMTYDLDILVKEPQYQRLRVLVPNWSRPHSFKVGKFEVEVLTPDFINLPENIVSYVFSTKKGNKPTAESVILLKLVSLRDIDKQDIERIMKTQGNDLNKADILDLMPSLEAETFFHSI